MQSGITTAIVPAAGWGSRMRPLTDALPKELLPLGRRTALQHIVYELAQTGIERIIFVVSPVKEPIVRAAFGASDPQSGVSFAYTVQSEMRGLGDAILRATPFVPEGEPILVALGDAVIAEQEPGGLTRRLLVAAEGNARTVGLTVQQVPYEKISRYGIVEPVTPTEIGYGPFFAIRNIIEKPSPETAPSRYAAAARYRLPYGVFEVLRHLAPDAKGEVQLTDAMRQLLAEGNPGVAVPLTEKEMRHDIGGFDSYYRAFIAYALADKEVGEVLRQELNQTIRTIKEPTVE